MDELTNPDFETVTTLRQYLIELYDTIVWAFKRNNIPLSEDLLTVTIPETLYDYAVLSDWWHQPTPIEPFSIAHDSVENSHAESFFSILEGQMAHWLHELELDKDRVWEAWVKKLMPSKPDLTENTPATLLEWWRQTNRQTNFTLLAEKAATISCGRTKSRTVEAILSAIYRISSGTNVNQGTLECLAEAMSTPTWRVEWYHLRWPKKPRQRQKRKKSANKE